MPVALPILLRALTIRLGPIAAALGVLFIAYVAVLLVRALFSPLRAIPFGVGSWLINQLDFIVAAVHNALITVLNDHARPLAQLFVQLGQEMSVAWDTTADFATNLAGDFAYWTTVGLHETIKAFTNPVLTIANAAKTAAADVATEVATLKTNTTHALTLLRRYVETELFGKAMAGIDKLRSDVFNDALPATVAGIDATIDGVRGEVTTVAEDLKGLAGQIPFTDIAALIAAVPLLQALTNTIADEAGLRNAECRSKVKGICSTDPSAWADMLGLLVTGLAMLEFEEFVRLCMEIFSAVEDDLVAYINP